MFSSPELFNEIFGITDHGLDFLWLWRNISLSDLNFFFILEAQKRSNRHIQTQDIQLQSDQKEKNTSWITGNLNIHLKKLQHYSITKLSNDPLIIIQNCFHVCFICLNSRILLPWT